MRHHRNRKSNNNSINSSYGCLMSVTCKGASGLTPLAHACRNGHYDICLLLVDNGADVHRTDDFGYTALHHASSNGNPDIVQLLLDREADVHQKSYNGSTPLHCASACSNIEAAFVLLDHGASLDEQDVMDKTPLHVAGSNDVKMAMVTYSPSSDDMREKVKVVIAQMDELLRCTKTVRAITTASSSSSSSPTNNNKENNHCSSSSPTTSSMLRAGNRGELVD